MIKHNFRCPAFSPFPLWLMPPLPASAPLLVPLPLWPPIHPNLRAGASFTALSQKPAYPHFLCAAFLVLLPGVTFLPFHISQILSYVTFKHPYFHFPHISLAIDASISRMTACLAHLWISHRAQHRAWHRASVPERQTETEGEREWIWIY